MLDEYVKRIQSAQTLRWRGRVIESIGNTIESAGPLASVGECCEIEELSGARHLAEVIGFRGSHVITMPLKSTSGVRFGDVVTALGMHPDVNVGPWMIGRILGTTGAASEDGKMVLNN